MTLFLVRLVVAVAYTGLPYLWLFKPCGRCKDSGPNRSSGSAPGKSTAPSVVQSATAAKSGDASDS